MNSIETKFTLKSNFKSNENVIVDFEFKNNTGEDLYVLPWNTPLEGLYSDCIVILGKENNKIEYDGIMKKRGNPTSEDLLFIKKGELKTSEINLSVAYDLSNQDQYTIEFNPENLVVFSVSSISNKGLLPLQESLKTSDIISNEKSSFKVNKSGEKIMTIGQINRINRKKKENESEEVVEILGLKDPKFIGGTNSQREKAKKAHSNGYTYAKNSIGKLGNDGSYKTWFGEHSNERINNVKSTYTKIKDRMESTEFTYEFNGPSCQPGDIAYTTKGGTKIWLCKTFDSLGDTGSDSKAGTIVHEHSHTSAETDDFAYGETKAKELAKSNPDKATKNADNFEYYSENETII